MDKVSKLKQQFTNSFLMKMYMLKNLPLGFLVGLRINHFTESETNVSVPYKYLTKNPFQSMYFAVQAMAAELSTAVACLYATQKEKSSVAFIIIKIEAEFKKKATDKVFFTCTENHKVEEVVRKCAQDFDTHETTLKTTGKMKDGTVVSEFYFTWSFKKRKTSP